MRAALDEARKAHGRTSPNPAVGCVIVKNGRVIARGHHRRAGLPHAEVEALRVAKKKAKGATLYVNLEPCCHEGRTGPCTEAVLAAGVKEVVVGMRDPNPLVNGKGLRILEKAGVKVRLGVLEHECRRLNEAFARWITSGRPHVTLKAAVTLDGRIAPAAWDDAPRWITGDEARAEAHRLRDVSDAILVGAGTVLADDPLLTTRLKGRAGRTPRRVVLDARGRVPETARVLAPVDGAAPTTVFLGHDVPRAREEALARAGAEVVRLDTRENAFSIAAVLEALRERNVTSVLVEGGAEVFTAFLRARLVDRVRVFVAPALYGDAALGFLRALPEPIHLENVTVTPFGSDVLFDGVPVFKAAAAARKVS